MAVTIKNPVTVMTGGDKIYRHRIIMRVIVSRGEIDQTLYLDILSSNSTEFNIVSLQQFLLTMTPYPLFGQFITDTSMQSGGVQGGIITQWISPAQGMSFMVFGDTKTYTVLQISSLSDTIYEV